MPLAPLPIDSTLPELIAQLRSRASIVLQAPTGAGKTTRVAPAILDSGIAGDGQVLLIEPRRVAAQAAAARMAEERNQPLGGEIGYAVRFESRTSKSTRIVAMTDGVFLRRVEHDPFLERTSVVIFDEFHERSLNADLGLALVAKIQREARPDLRIVVMSATLDPTPIAKFLGDCPVLVSEGRLYPVTKEYLSYPVAGPIEPAVASAVERVVGATEGGVLAFLPGVKSIRQTAALLEPLARNSDIAIHMLYGDMPLEEQRRVLAPSDRRKIVLATNVAETSVTIEGVTAVVDSGLANVMRVDLAFGLNRLRRERISQASADQRAGRAGRVAPGLCVRLWTEREQRGMPPTDTPEIHRVDLSAAALTLLSWGEKDLAKFCWFEAPSAESLDAAIRLLRMLGAVDDAGVTPLGRMMNELPLHPRLARLAIEGARLGQPQRAALAAAILAERPTASSRDIGSRPRESDSDVLDRVLRVEKGVAGGRTLLRARDHVLRALEKLPIERTQSDISADEALLRALVPALADRVARRRSSRDARALMVGGRGVRLDAASSVRQAELFVAVEIAEVGAAEAIVRQASRVEREWLPPEQITTSVDVEFDPQRERVVAFRRVRFNDLVLDSAPTNIPPDVDTSQILAREALARLSLNDLLDDAVSNVIARLEFLAQWLPEAELPRIDSDALHDMLPLLCAGRQSFDELRRAPIADILLSTLDYQQRELLDREAPAQWQAPSGRSIPIRYERGRAPIVSVRIQEIFGLAATPRVARGRVALLLELLGPNMRPQQITDDLASFWKNTYPQIRKDLRRRYPKHAWPEDGATAAPQQQHRRPRTPPG